MKIHYLFLSFFFVGFLFAQDSAPPYTMTVINPLLLQVGDKNIENAITQQEQLLNEMRRERDFSKGLLNHKKYDAAFADEVLQKSVSIANIKKALEYSKNVTHIGGAVARINAIDPRNGIEFRNVSSTAGGITMELFQSKFNNISVKQLVKDTRSFFVLSAYFPTLTDSQKIALSERDVSAYMINLKPMDFLRLQPQLQEILVLNDSIDDDFFEEVLHTLDTIEARRTFLKMMSPRYTKQAIEFCAEHEKAVKALK